MNNYHLEQPVKTKFLNFFRKVFTFPFFEKLLVEKTISNPSPLLKKIIPANYLFSKGTNRSVTRDGINLNLDISNVVDHYLYFGLTDSHYDSVLEDIKKSKVIFDIGANIGATALYFAHINPDAEVYACEPHPDTYKKARENLQLNDCKNITLMNIGL